MHPSELNPNGNPEPYFSPERARQVYANQGKRKSSLLTRIIFLGALAIGGYHIHGCVSERLEEAKVPEHSENKPVHKQSLMIPLDCLHLFSELRKRHVPQEDLDLTAKIIKIESDFNHSLVGRNGDAGYGQLTKINIEDNIEESLLHPGTANSHLMRLSLNDISRKDLAHYIGPKGWKRTFARSKVVDKIYSKVRHSKKDDLFVTTATVRYEKADVLSLCRQFNVPYSEELVQKYHNAPNRIKEAMRKYGRNWSKDSRIPTITANRDISRFYVPSIRQIGRSHRRVLKH